MKLFSSVLYTSAIILTLSGCVQTYPLISHAHLGHTLTSWHDTPDNAGLLITAKKEVAVAMREADLAWLAQSDPNKVNYHLNNVVNALNPDLQPIGTGEGYGAVRALEGAVEHIEYAASSDDASLNMVASVAVLGEQGATIIQRLKAAVELTQTSQNADAQALGNIAFKLRHQLKFAVVGRDLDNSGSIGNESAEIGLNQFDDQLQAMLDRETDPPYEPLERKYVLGLVRLPNGTWDFRIGRPLRRSTSAGYASY
ncbi:MAG: hypothetical protein ACR2PS_06160 [Pseudomonadales bacterium]